MAHVHRSTTLERCDTIRAGGLSPRKVDITAPTPPDNRGRSGRGKSSIQWCSRKFFVSFCDRAVLIHVKAFKSWSCLFRRSFSTWTRNGIHYATLVTISKYVPNCLAVVWSDVFQLTRSIIFNHELILHHRMTRQQMDDHNFDCMRPKKLVAAKYVSMDGDLTPKPTEMIPQSISHSIAGHADNGAHGLKLQTHVFIYAHVWIALWSCCVFCAQSDTYDI